MMLRTTIPLACFGAVVLLTAFDRPLVGAALPSLSAETRAPRSAPSRSAPIRPMPVRSVPTTSLQARRAAVTPQDSTPLYTEEQATAGAAIFGKICAECHEKTDIAGSDFRAKWTSRTLFDLFELVRTTMPDSNPGGLSRDDYAAALAYILKQNGLPAGPSPVMPDSVAMKNFKLDLPPIAP
jgi:S-disulfanyl-L-cysteine oxidoreductase SoxD